MKVDIITPKPGESIDEVEVSSWLKADGDFVEKGDNIVTIESEKATLDIVADISGILSITTKQGETVSTGQIIGSISDDNIDARMGSKDQASSSLSGELKLDDNFEVNVRNTTEEDLSSKVLIDEITSIIEENEPKVIEEIPEVLEVSETALSPSAVKILAENQISPDEVAGTGKGNRITKEDALNAVATKNNPVSQTSTNEIKNNVSLDNQGNISEPQNRSRNIVESEKTELGAGALSDRKTRSEKLTVFRRKLAQRLVEVKNTTAMLTTFNEVDMSAIVDIRSKYKETFKTKHDVGLGFMAFFVSACSQALQEFPLVNGYIDGDNLITHNYVDMGIAVSTPKGVVAPVIRNAHKLSLQEIEKEILRLATKARDGKLSIDEMSGGTFTITNGGIFGSMLSTPLLNPPQSAILGMHNIVKRPIVVDDQIVIRPIMYLAMSYDHRIIDGRESVNCLFRIKEMLEDPTRLLLKI